MAFPILTAQEAAELINHDDNVGFSGFDRFFYKSSI